MIQQSGIPKDRPIFIINGRWVRPLTAWESRGLRETTASCIEFMMSDRLVIKIAAPESTVSMRPSGRLVWAIDGHEEVVRIHD